MHWKVLTFIKPSEAPQRSMKIKFKLIFSPRSGSGREVLNHTENKTNVQEKQTLGQRWYLRGSGIHWWTQI